MIDTGCRDLVFPMSIIIPKVLTLKILMNLETSLQVNYLRDGILCPSGGFKIEFELALKLSWLLEAIVACTSNFRSLAHLEQPPQVLVDFSIMANNVENDKIKNVGK